MFTITWYGVTKEHTKDEKVLADIITRYIMIEGIDACALALGLVYQEDLTHLFITPAIKNLLKEREDIK